MKNNILNSTISISKKYLYIIMFSVLITSTCIADTLELSSQGTGYDTITMTATIYDGASYNYSLASFHSLSGGEMSVSLLTNNGGGNGSGSWRCPVSNGRGDIRISSGTYGSCTFRLNFKDLSPRDKPIIQLVRAQAMSDNTTIKYTTASGSSYTFAKGAQNNVHNIEITPLITSSTPQRWVAEYPSAINLDVDKSIEQQILRVSEGNTSANVSMNLQIKNDSGGNISRAISLEKNTGGNCNSRFSYGEQCILKVTSDVLPVGKHEGVINITANLS